MRIVVTGGAGFIGSTVVDAYLAEGHEVTVIDSLWEHGGGNRAHVAARARFIQMDITDPALGDVLAEVRPQVVNHHAAQHTVKLSTDDPAFDARVNILGLLNVLEGSRRAGAEKVIYASSAATYGTPPALPITEATPQMPESPYGITKMAGEHYLRYYSAAYGLRHTALRYANVYGPRQSPTGEAGVIAIFTHRLLGREPITINGDGEYGRDYVYVGDIARANVLALGAGDGRAYCLGTGVVTTVNDLYRTLVATTGYDVPVTYGPPRPGDSRISYFDNRRAREELGWTPTVALPQGLAQTVAAAR